MAQQKSLEKIDTQVWEQIDSFLIGRTTERHQPFVYYTPCRNDFETVTFDPTAE